jgi:hypothetical protein
MKKQYMAIWSTVDGNRHELWPIYAHSEDEAKAQIVDFIDYSKKTEFTVMDSITIKTP